MADLVVQALSEPAQTVTEACVANRVADLAVETDIRTVGVQGVGGEGGIYQSGQPQLEEQERAVSRIAIVGVLSILLLELINGQSLVNMFGNL